MEYQRDVLNVAVVNFKAATGNKKNNLQRIIDFSIAAAKRGADLVLFPELCLTGYDYFVNENIDFHEKNINGRNAAGAIMFCDCRSGKEIWHLYCFRNGRKIGRERRDRI